jgi:hypothetical protein
MPHEDAKISINFRSLATLLAVGLVLAIFPACKPPKVVSSQISGGEVGSEGTLQLAGPVQAPGFETAQQTAANGDLDPSSETVDQINAFLLNAQQDLLAHRAQTMESWPESGMRTAKPSIDPLPSLEPSELPEPETTASSVPLAPVELVLLSALDDAPANESATSISALDRGPVDPISPWIKSLLASASQSDAPLKQHLTLAIVLGMTRPDQPFEPEGLAELTDQEQDLVGIVHEQFQLLGRELEAGGDTTAVLASLGELIGQVKAEQPFRISRLALCTGVQDYGVVDVVEPPIFAPRERGGFIWYLELDGVEPRQDEEAGTWYYEFDLKLEMLTRDTGIPVIAPIEGTVRHTASSEVRDFYLRDLFDIPADLQFDWYTTKLTVVERSSGSQAQRSADLLWVPNLAAGDAHLQQHTAAASTD